MFSTLRAPPAHGAQLVSSCSAQAGTAFLMPAADTELAASTETHGGKVQSRVGKNSGLNLEPTLKKKNKLIMLESRDLLIRGNTQMSGVKS